MFARHPALKLCLIYTAGIVIGWYSALQLAWLIAGLTVCAILSAIARRNSPGSVYATLLLVSTLCFCGVVKITLDGKYHTDSSILNFVSEDDVSVSISGTVIRKPVAKERSYSWFLSAESLFINKQAFPVEGDIQVSLSKEQTEKAFVERLRYGQKVVCIGKISLPATARNPGEFDYRAYLALRGVYARLRIASDEDISLREQGGGFLMRGVIHPFREWISDVMDSHIGGDEATLLKGLVVGERSELDPEIKTAFINAGLMHLLAVSGLNVGLITVMFWAVFSLFRLPRMLIGILTVSSLCLFALITGGEASVLRAVIMASIFIGAKVLERKTSILNVVAFSALCILAYDARMLFDVGFQLSYAGVISLAVLYPKIEAKVKILPGTEQTPSFIKKYVILATAVSIAATIGTLPLTLYYFHQVSIIGIVLNIIAVPLSGVVLTMGCVVVLAAAFSSLLASVCAIAAYGSAWLLLHIAEWGGAFPFSVIEWNISLPFAFGMFLVILVLFELQNSVLRKYTVIGLLLAANYWVYSSVVIPDKSHFKVTMLDIGQGDALVFELPNKKVFLIDAGPREFGRDAGTVAILPFLERKGIDTIAAIFITHPHADHCGGVPAVLKSLPVQKLYLSDAVSESKLAREIDSLAVELSIPTERVIAGQTVSIDSTVRIYILHPFSLEDEPESNLNNHSLSLKIVYGSASIIAGGDAEEPVEHELVTAYGELLDSDILKAGHHGSITSSSPDFLQAVSPQVALLSVGKNNKFRHPSPLVLERYTQLGCMYYRTDKERAIVLESDGASWKKIEWKGD